MSSPVPTTPSDLIMSSPNQSRLLELFDYNPETGVFARRTSVAHQKKGAIAGSIDANGYVVIVVDGKPYKAHRLAWIYMTGQQPPAVIDHADRCPANNAWVNLRAASRAQNGANAKVSKANKSGIRGVHWASNVRKWRADIRVNGARKCLGFFNDKDDAADIYGLASALIHGEFSNV